MGKGRFETAWVRRLAAVAVIALVAAASGIGGAAWATHQFSDVADGSFFGPSINEGATAGCFTGYGDGTFRPNERPTRGQFAFWVHNCASRAASNTIPASPALGGSTNTTLVQLGVEVRGSGTQKVHLTATVDVSSNGTLVNSCSNNSSCGASFELREGGTTLSGSHFFRKGRDGTEQQTITFTTLVDAAAGQHTYTLIGRGFLLDPGVPVQTQNATISAVVVPFSALPAP